MQELETYFSKNSYHLKDVNSWQVEKDAALIEPEKGVVKTLLEECDFIECDVKQKLGGSFEGYTFLRCKFIRCTEVPVDNCFNCLLEPLGINLGKPLDFSSISTDVQSD